ncbi:ABC transporter substrate-binding protein [Caballeronia humi]|uniref:ABC sugar transporter, periplasmic ligand binding protein n=1 Tax=Caballeronia humi TaxID=326474 RepID=A0A158GIJ2_9BURK|nr:extracellular solute-binding protein [Caballeronia humi]SAL31661.1 ABC sugar transporter, periplasmic ligand binding protein [Caballeronia humi]
MKLLRLASAAVAMAAAGLIAGTAQAAEDFKGVTVNVMTFVGPQIAEPLQRRAPEFEKLTGAKVNILTVPFSDLYQKLLTDWASGTNSVDAAVFAPQWMVDYTKGNFLEDLSGRIAKDAALKEGDVMPFFVDFSQKFNGKTYLVALDGDFQMVYYRTDILKALGKQPPKTWDDYLDIAKAANGKTFEGGDGKPVAGSCISKKRNAQAYWAIISIAGGYLQSKGTAQGAFFDPRTFKPLVNNDAFKAALNVLKESTSYGPPNEINLDVGDTRSAFISGHCALTLDWGDVGVLAIDPKQSKVIDKVGAVILPGSTKVLNRDTGKLVPCDKSTCPYAVDGVNHAPFAAFGGWSGGVNSKAKPKVKEAAYAFLSYMSQPAQSNVDVTIGATGFNPYRRSQFTDMAMWKKAGMSEPAANSYLGAIKSSLESPNMIIDLRIPQNQRYEQVVLDTAVARFLAGELDADATMKAIQSGWDEITEDLNKDTQLRAYKASIGAK